MQDPEDIQLERGFYFRDTPLANYSFNYRSSLYRLGEGYRLPFFEEVIYTVFMLAHKTPAEMDAIRSAESIAAFREEAGAWADENQLNDGKGWEEIKALHQSILNPVAAAEAIEPAPTAGRKKRGK
jgi:hypothetical protein